MIQFKDLSQAKPYRKFEDLYNKASAHDQKSIEAICISSCSNNEVDSRLVNLKYIIEIIIKAFSGCCPLKVIGEPDIIP